MNINTVIIEEIVAGVQRVELGFVCKCSRCRKELKGVAYVESFLIHLGFIFCSPDCIRKMLEYPFTQEAFSNAIGSIMKDKWRHP